MIGGGQVKYKLRQSKCPKCGKWKNLSFRDLISRMCLECVEEYKELLISTCAICGSVLQKEFPSGYPKDLMLCCRCLGALHWHFGLNTDHIEDFYHYTNDHSRMIWNMFGEKIMKALKIQ